MSPEKTGEIFIISQLVFFAWTILSFLILGNAEFQEKDLSFVGKIVILPLYIIFFIGKIASKILYKDGK